MATRAFREFPGQLVPPLRRVWTNIQVSLSGLIRWEENYLKKGHPVREQSDSEHSHAMTMFAAAVMCLFRPQRSARNWDQALMLTAVTLHDTGEGLKSVAEKSERDIPATRKTDEHDLVEYLAFCEEYRVFPPEVFDAFERAFLLQFALKDHVIFPEHARQVMTDLRLDRFEECWLFMAIEKWDYLLFALEQLEERGISLCCYNVIDNCIPHFEAVSKNLPGFREYFWSEEIEAWCREFLEHHRAEFAHLDP